MELLLISAVPVVGAGAAFVLSVAAALLMFSVEAWVEARMPQISTIPLKVVRKVRG